jgi:hypothetical protein
MGAVENDREPASPASDSEWKGSKVEGIAESGKRREIEEIIKSRRSVDCVDFD